MSPTKTPTSSLSAVELLINRVWYRGLALIRKMCEWGPSPETRTTPPYPRLPQEIVGIIIAYLIYDTPSLQACSLTCYSLYIATVPHLHHTFTFDASGLWPWGPTFCSRCMRGHQSPNSIWSMNALGLLPLVQKLHICDTGYSWKIRPEMFLRSILHKFSALSNVRELRIEYLNIPKFMPRPQQFFRHFLPTLRSLALIYPEGSHRQVIYFVGLFQHLEDLELHFGWHKYVQGEPADDWAPIPDFAPPLRGRLAMSYSGGEHVEDMIRLFGGIRFRSMDLFCVSRVELLWGACVGTLETLRLYVTDPLSEQLYQGGI